MTFEEIRKMNNRRKALYRQLREMHKDLNIASSNNDFEIVDEIRDQGVKTKIEINDIERRIGIR